MKKDSKEIQKELEDLSTHLSEMKKEEGFKVPANYFESLSDEILQKVQTPQEEKQPHTISGLDKLWNIFSLILQPKRIAAFASILLIFGLSFYFLNLKIEEPLVSTVDFTAKDAQWYLAENLDEFEEDLIFEVISEEELDFFSELELNEGETEELFEELFEDIDDELLEELL